MEEDEQWKWERNTGKTEKASTKTYSTHHLRIKLNDRINKLLPIVLLLPNHLHPRCPTRILIKRHNPRNTLLLRQAGYPIDEYPFEAAAFPEPFPETKRRPEAYRYHIVSIAIIYAADGGLVGLVVLPTPPPTFLEQGLLNTKGVEGDDLNGRFSTAGQGRGRGGGGRACLPSSMGVVEVSTTTGVPSLWFAFLAAAEAETTEAASQPTHDRALQPLSRRPLRLLQHQPHHQARPRSHPALSGTRIAES